MYYNEVRKGKGKEEEEYCKLDEERFLQKPISNVDLVNRINKIMMQIKRPEIPQNT
jgi:hypothetical protein